MALFVCEFNTSGVYGSVETGEEEESTPSKLHKLLKAVGLKMLTGATLIFLIAERTGR